MLNLEAGNIVVLTLIAWSKAMLPTNRFQHSCAVVLYELNDMNTVAGHFSDMRSEPPFSVLMEFSVKGSTSSSCKMRIRELSSAFLIVYCVLSDLIFRNKSSRNLLAISRCSMSNADNFCNLFC